MKLILAIGAVYSPYTCKFILKLHPRNKQTTFLSEVYPENTREIRWFFCEFVPENPVKFDFFLCNLSEALSNIDAYIFVKMVY